MRTQIVGALSAGIMPANMPRIVDATGADIAEAYRTVRAELKAYGAGLEKKKEIVALSKCDALDEASIAAKVSELQAVARKKPLRLSAVSRAGVREVLAALAREITAVRAKQRAQETSRERQTWQP